MESYFNDIARVIDAALIAGERHASWFSAEDSDFVRMNRGKVRQPGTVSQRFIEIRLIKGARHASNALTLSGALEADARAINAAIASLRNALPQLADDPHLLLPTTIASSRSARGTTLPSCEAIVAKMLDAAAGLDLVGLAAAGPVYRGFANSEGQRNWHVVSTFNLQWSLYHRADKAVKASYSDVEWSDEAFGERMRSSIEQLRLISMPPKSLQPGRYRAYLSPAAMHEIVELLAYGAFSARSLETQQSALSRMRADARLDSHVQIVEDFASGVAPPFQAEGFARPASVPLVSNGQLAGALVSPRTAREFGLDANGANGAESPEALSIGGGTIAARDALRALDTGLAVGNLWYLNYSDRPACRMTGMTRFATFWVERGAVVGPANVLRFDDTLYRMLGDNLEALTAERELLLSSSTYGARMLTSATLPGALVSEMNFTL
ncbi:MAG TPA: metallopeptidase TldD-related protein [Casimicrobiaceae bacterium]|jgi:predicted Zn-dependent protease|nr:metallopeptidase TldD-related protein [Casimicrobiaceae bacterium]